MNDLINVILLGIIEGITEFLPISSTGHLLIGERWLGARSDLFNIGIQAGAILAVGNAPTALLTIADLIETAGLRPALVIGVPVGFVNVVESKERLIAVCESHGVPAIVAMGRKGGSNVAAAICNALIYSAAEMLDPTARGWK